MTVMIDQEIQMLLDKLFYDDLPENEKEEIRVAIEVLEHQRHQENLADVAMVEDVLY